MRVRRWLSSALAVAGAFLSLPEATPGWSGQDVSSTKTPVAWPTDFEASVFLKIIASTGKPGEANTATEALLTEHAKRELRDLGDVEIATEQHGTTRVADLVQPARQSVEPAQLAFVPGRVQLPAVGRVETDHANTAGQLLPNSNVHDIWCRGAYPAVAWCNV